MREIILNRRSKKSKYYKKYKALVDDADFNYLNQWGWNVLIEPHTIYAVRTDHSGLKDKKILMHRLIMGLYKKGTELVKIDHIDHNGLNNQKYNIRIASDLLNSKNKLQIKKKSLLKGVSVSSKNRFRVRIMANGKKIYIGLFKSEYEAALAYNEAAKKYHGEFASLNVIQTT